MIKTRKSVDNILILLICFQRIVKQLLLDRGPNNNRLSEHTYVFFFFLRALGYIVSILSRASPITTVPRNAFIIIRCTTENYKFPLFIIPFECSTNNNSRHYNHDLRLYYYPSSEADCCNNNTNTYTCTLNVFDYESLRSRVRMVGKSSRQMCSASSWYCDNKYVRPSS